MLAPAVTDSLGVRSMLLAAGTFALVAWLVPTFALRKSWTEPAPTGATLVGEALRRGS